MKQNFFFLIIFMFCHIEIFTMGFEAAPGQNQQNQFNPNNHNGDNFNGCPFDREICTKNNVKLVARMLGDETCNFLWRGNDRDYWMYRTIYGSFFLILIMNKTGLLKKLSYH